MGTTSSRSLFSGQVRRINLEQTGRNRRRWRTRARAASITSQRDSSSAAACCRLRRPAVRRRTLFDGEIASTERKRFRVVLVVGDAIRRIHCWHQTLKPTMPARSRAIGGARNHRIKSGATYC